MVSEEAKVAKESPERKAQASEGKKKVKIKAFPLGTAEGKKEARGGNNDPQEISAETKEVAAEEDRKSGDSSEPPKETIKSPSGEKEANMPLDDEGKEFVRERVKEEVGPLKEKLGSVEKVVQNAATSGAVEKVHQAIETLEEKVAATASSTTEAKDTEVDEDRVADKVRKRIKQEQEEEKQRVERNEAARIEREKEKKFRDWCLRNPEAAECKDIGEFIDKRIDKKTAAKKEEPATPKTGTELQPLEKMTDDKRDTWTEEQNLTRDAQVKAIVDQFNISANDQARGILGDPTNRENLVKKTELRETFIKSVTDDESLGIIKARCEGDACQVKFREGGITVFKLGEDGKWTPLDKEVAKQMKPLF